MSRKQKYLKELEKLKENIIKKYKPEKIILFGSYAWGKPGPDSDVDLFVIKETENTRETAREIDGSIFPRPFPLDLIVYTAGQVDRRRKIGDPFIINILTKGKVLYAKNS